MPRVDPKIPFEGVFLDSITPADPHAPRVGEVNGDGTADGVLLLDGVFNIFQNLAADQHVLVSVSDGMNEHDPGEPGFVPSVIISYGHFNEEGSRKAKPVEREDQDRIERALVGGVLEPLPLGLVLHGRGILLEDLNDCEATSLGKLQHGGSLIAGVAPLGAAPEVYASSAATVMLGSVPKVHAHPLYDLARAGMNSPGSAPRSCSTRRILNSVGRNPPADRPPRVASPQHAARKGP